MAIADCSHKCALLFDQLTHQLGSNENGAELSTAALSDEYGRFKIWAANIGAFHPGTSSRSLDYRLREASQMGDQVEKILKDLKVSLGECM